MAFGSWRLVQIGRPIGGGDDRELHRVAIRLGQAAQFHHAVENVVPARLQRGQIGLGVQERRALDDGRENCAFLDTQLTDRLVEVRVRRGGDAVRTATEVDGVEIRGKNVVLGPFARHLGGDDKLTQLPVDTALVTDQDVLHVLLSDRRATAGAFLAHHVVSGSASKSGDREAGVGVEVAILRREHRIADVNRDGRQRDLGAVSLRRHYLAEHGRAVGHVDGGHLIGLHVRGARDVGPAVRDSKNRRGHDDHQEHEHVDGPPDEPPLRALLFRGLGRLVRPGRISRLARSSRRLIATRRTRSVRWTHSTLPVVDPDLPAPFHQGDISIR